MVDFHEERKNTLISLEYEVQNQSIQDIHQYLMTCKYRSWELAVFTYREWSKPIHGVFKEIQENNLSRLLEVFIMFYDLKFTKYELLESEEILSSIKKITEHL